MRVLRHWAGVGCVAIAGLLSACSHGAGGDGDPPAARASDAGAPIASIGAGAAPSGCGTAGLPECPLQAWMKANLSTALMAKDLPRLRRGFSKLEAMGPPGYDGWAADARSGLDAADGGDLEAAKRACKRCHDEYRSRYRAERRASPL